MPNKKKNKGKENKKA